MKRIVAYRQHYKIAVMGKFYEVLDGNRLVYFGESKHTPTIQEIFNKTIGQEQEQKEIELLKRKQRARQICCA